ncbi:MAG: tRNA 2-thiouridine(34) synthase MnmA [Actinobacteria bacterium]|nr:MAG: tRNA 2-thiouridine(34) synthase MnmA [Actinomycetota bacterium]
MSTMIAVGMSGGVDSSVAAALLLEDGYDVVGVTMRLGLAEAAGRACCGEQDALDARRVCDALDIRHVVLDMSEEFASAVLEPYGTALAAGTTPNPCVWCNEHVKFGALVDGVRRLGIELLATGHYVRIADGETGPLLSRGRDAEKDQSYFLYRVRQEMLRRAVFPLGNLEKHEVRGIAQSLGLAVASRQDSQDLCFSAEREAILRSSHPQLFMPGPITTADGAVLGMHRGLAYYTVGQRRGLGIGGIAPHRVVALEPGTNTVVIEPSTATVIRSVRLGDPVWHLSEAGAVVQAQTRYRTATIPSRAVYGRGEITVEFDRDSAPVAPGQSVVLYRDDAVVGGGIVVRGR